MHASMLTEAPKPGHLFDRDAEWKGLVSFAADARPGGTLGVVSGRRRQGQELSPAGADGGSGRDLLSCLGGDRGGLAPVVR